MANWGPLHCLYVFVCARSVNSIMSNSLWYYRLQPSRFLCPWEMPLKKDQNYKMGASPLPVCVCVCVCVCVRVRARTCSVNSIVSNSLWHCRMPARLLCPRDSPGKNTGVGCHALLQGICLTHRLNPHLLCLLHFRQILYPLSHLESPSVACFWSLFSWYLWVHTFVTMLTK